ncbi:hypothetical protein [Nannocystis punicea]|uniref:Uncharacterized protein n=1 Tax=Nannocystis punicea TaxID=2995304 RepID=A0ABY7GRW7_9BACT|nr:hypothetical protein [Nannocystis poenicansa]WAS89674.1 hypothetical protein O0S08_26065 [Nannocystis poenicansa]
MDTRTLKISRPCPIDLDADRSGRQFFCDHCQKDVHVLANWPRAEAEAFLAANRGRSVCVSLRRDAQGELQYADSPRARPSALVPAARLLRRWLPEAAAAAGVAAALSACTPHGPVKGADKLATEEEVVMRSIAGGVNVPQALEPPTPEQVMDGELAPEPRIERGEKPAITPPPAARPKAPTRAPKAKPEPEKEPVLQEFDGGIDL